MAAVLAPSAAQGAETFEAVTNDNRLVGLNSDGPAAIQRAVPITGVMPGEQVIGLDVRPLNAGLYGLTNQNRLYTINSITGAARAVSGTPFTPGLSGQNFGFDFNPQVDRIRVVSDLEQNLRLNPDNATVTNNDPALNYIPGDPGVGSAPSVAAVAYTNPFPGATATQLFGIDSTRDTLVLIDPPNLGRMRTIGSLGIDVVEPVAFDIAQNGTAYLAGRRTGLANSSLFRVDLTTGRATRAADEALIGPALGPRGAGGGVRALAAIGGVADDRVSPVTLVAANSLQPKASLRRSGLVFGVSCSEYCAVRGELFIPGTGNVVAGTVGSLFPEAARGTLRIRLTPTGRSRLNRRGAQRGRLRVVTTDAAGNARVTTRTFTAR